ncbi:hypothetical protein [Hydrogenovibrio marinus]|uniref:Uncharacterized protein n=1 Tax=Hydrogenovibrio marinus TaxID=28885 RepID=A0A066ZLL4_HYDMR|nr:hypothetical protein [Hydrogenovibrio marinus]KDN94673.1 hypothetical protein EI16_12300 [Hydrogenovibrio marinus]
MDAIPMDTKKTSKYEIVGAGAGIAGAITMSFMPSLALFAWIVWLGSEIKVFVCFANDFHVN